MIERVKMTHIEYQNIAINLSSFPGLAKTPQRVRAFLFDESHSEHIGQGVRSLTSVFRIMI